MTTKRKPAWDKLTSQQQLVLMGAVMTAPIDDIEKIAEAVVNCYERVRLAPFIDTDTAAKLSRENHD